MERPPFADYAFRDEDTAGRRYPEALHPYRGPFQRDRDRIIHCAAFRRLSEKMQVFTAEFGNYHRTRLTHTMEVVGVARTLGRALGLNEDFIEAAALLHDVGHPPFGHSGEAVLDLLLQNDGGFDHNGQALRIVEKLERRYIDFPGLNLSRELLEGQAYKMHKKRTAGHAPLLEIQVVDMADSIAYDTHDVDDALEIGLLRTTQMVETTLWKNAAQNVRRRWSRLEEDDFHRALVHDLIDIQISDVLRATRARLEARGIKNFSEALTEGILVAPSAEIAEQKAEAEAFLLEKVYRHPRVMSLRSKAGEWMETIFNRLADMPEQLPKRYESVLKHEGVRRAVADYLADMTDRSARLESLRAKNRSIRSPVEKISASET